ncbi:MAG: FAD/NAD(P)-binding protein [Caulobacteraceae bacterium]|nr:FAD/NAD(P)-binding protein [Caulobacteraceae bacterium]
MRNRPVVAIVGAGFSGSLLALHLLQAGPADLRILLIERAPGFGRGLAYGAHDPAHLLNVRVGNMSAWPDKPLHLQHWLACQPGCGEVGPSAFIARETYGRYLSSMLQAAVARPDGAQRLVLVHDEATRLEHRPDGLVLTFAMGHSLVVDALVLATGNPPPGPLPGVGLGELPAHLYVPDPWARRAFDGLSAASRVVLLGTGLTMVDVAMALETRGGVASVLAISRRGLTPRRHEGAPYLAGEAPAPQAATLSGLVRQVRRRAGTIGWRAAIDELRPVTQSLWRGAPLAQRRRFLRHLRPWWDVHRHRMAPETAERIEAMAGDGRLTVAARRILGVEAEGDAVAIRWRRRGGGEETARADRIVNCTGPGGDLARSSEPLLRGLVETGAVRPDALGFGLEVDGDNRVVGADGTADPRLYAVGPITRGVFWEIIAVPDIRNQVADLAVRLSRQFRAKALV